MNGLHVMVTYLGYIYIYIYVCEIQTIYTVLCFFVSYLVAATGLQSLWSLALASVDVYAIMVKRSLQNPRLVSLFAIGDGVRDLSNALMNRF